MKKRRYLVLLPLVLAMPLGYAGPEAWLKDQLKKADAPSSHVDAKTVAAGLREALEQGARRAVQTLGRENGFWLHPTLRIPAPERLQNVEKLLRKLDQDRVADDFIQSLNHAAEQATPAARAIFVGAIRKMTVEDALGILKGSADAATQYFRRSTEQQLAAAFLPIVARSTLSVGATARYKKLVDRVEPYGLVDKQELDLDNYVTRKALDGLFSLVAEEEKRVRETPVARTTELLRKVFR